MGRYQPSSCGAYAVFLGDGIELMESSIKGRADNTLMALAVIGETDDDGQPPDLTGLSCRWSPLKSARGKMVALVLRCADHGALHAELTKLAGVPALNAASLENLQSRWPPKGLIREAKARRRGKSLVLTAAQVAWDTLIAYIFFKFKLTAGKFSAERYRDELQRGAVDFARTGITLALVFDCPADRIDAIRGYLEARSGEGEFHYGMHISDHAVMTCLVMSAEDGKHVHFVDGGDGGYTKAATQMKGRLRRT